MSDEIFDEDESEEWGLIRDFDIDGDKLDGMSEQECFVLGYELALIDELLGTESREFERAVHAANKERIENAVTNSGREFSITWMEGDKSESWMLLKVGPESLPELTEEEKADLGGMGEIAWEHFDQEASAPETLFRLAFRRGGNVIVEIFTDMQEMKNRAMGKDLISISSYTKSYERGGDG